MKQTKGAIGNLLNRYRAVLKKCHLLNTFGSLAVAGMLVMGGAGVAGAQSLPDTLNSDITLGDSDAPYFVTDGTNQILDLNGYQITTESSSFETSTEDKDSIIVVKRGSSLTINDTSGTSGAISGDNIMVAIKVTGTKDSKEDDAAIAELIVNGGNISGSTYAISGNGTRHNTYIEINGGNISSKNLAIYHPQDGEMKITGGKISGNNTGIEMRSGDLTITGGEISGNAEEFSQSANDGGPTTIGAALAISQHTTNKDINVTISGGKFTGYYAIVEKDLQDGEGIIHLNITGGEFDGKIYSENVENFITGGTFTDPTALHYLGEGANVQVNLKKDYRGEEAGALNADEPFKIKENRTVNMNLGGHKFSMTEAGNTSAGNVSITNGMLRVEKDLTVTGGILSFSDNGKMTIASHAVASFQEGSILEVDENEIASANATSIITVEGGTLTVDPDATLRVNNPIAGTYNVVDGSTSAWQKIEASSDMIKLTMDSNGNLTGETQDATSVFSGLSGEAASLVSDLYHLQDTRNTTESTIPGIKFLRRATDNNYLGADKKAAASTIESAARMAFAGAVPQMTKMASDAATNAVVNRLSFANPDNGAKAMNVDGKLVDDKALGLALWIAPLWSNQTGFGMEAGNLDYGYNANLGGISLGADYTWANNIRAGLMFNIGGGYAESAGGDLSETTNSMTFWGVGAYGGWEYNNFAVMADVSYTSTWNSVDQDLDHRMQMSDLEADIQASAISAGLRFEYKLETQYLDLIPHVGVRYMSINTWGYDVDSADGTILEGDGFQQNIWTFPVGITFSKEVEMNNDWYFKPAVDFTVIPAAGDIKAKQDVLFTGMQRSYELETQMMDYFTWQGGVGLEFGNENMSVGVNYTLQAGQNSTGHGVFGMFRYEF